MRLFAALLGLLLVGPPATASAQSAKAELKDAQGKVVGTAMLNEVSGGVKIALKASGLKTGDHGFHIHAVGKCEPPAFTSAGGHFNPQSKKHGRLSPDGAHAGDLPNLKMGADGTGSIDVTAGGVTLKDVAGLALVIHADPDDEKTDPTGNSGARVACGVISK
ncbi:MAG: superoxide dismutase family protein [candidate division NC10 bacterium]